MIKCRRKHPRLQIPLEAEYLVEGSDDWRQATIQTLGAGGVGMLCEQELEPKTTRLRLRFVLQAESDLPETRLEVGAKVANASRRADVGRQVSYLIGLEFSDLEGQELELLRQFVFHRLKIRAGGEQRSADGGKRGELETPIAIQFKRFNDFVEEVSENLSPTGMFIRANKPLPPGSQLNFQFQLGEEFSLFQGTAEVVWTRRRSEGPDRPPGMGVRFLKLDLTSQKVVTRLVERRGREAEPAAGGDEDQGDRPDGGAPLKIAAGEEPFDMASPATAPAAEGAAGPPAAEAARQRKKAQAREARLRRRVEKLEKQQRQAEVARDGLQERLEATTAEKESLAREVERLEAAETARAEAEASAAEAREKPQPEESAASELEAEIERLTAGRSELEAEVERLTTAESELKAENEQLAAAESALREEVERLNASEADLVQQLEEQAAEAVDLEEQLETAAGVEAELKQRLEQVQGAHDELEQRLERDSGAAAELEKLRQEEEDRRSEWEAAESKLRQELDELRAGEAELRGEKDALAASESELREEVERRAAAEAELRREVERLSAAESELQERLDAAGAAEDELRQSLEKASAAETEIEQRLEQAVRDRDELERRLEGSLAIESELRERLADLEPALEAAVADRDTLRLQVDEQQATLQSAGNEVRRFRRVAENLERQLGAADPADGADVAPTGLPGNGDGLALERAAAVAFFTGESDSTAGPDLADPADETVPPAGDSWSERSQEGTGDNGGGGAARARAAIQARREAARAALEPGDDPEEAEAEAEAWAGTEPQARPGAGGLFGAARRAFRRLGLGGEGAAVADGGNGDGAAGEPDAAIGEPARPDGAGAGDLEPLAEAAPAEEEIEETVKAWAAAWSEQRVADYLGFYSNRFKPPQETAAGDKPGSGRQAWVPPLSGNELKLGPILQTTVAPDRVAVRFEQSVETDAFTRKVDRELELVWEGGAWKIAAESFQEHAG